MSVTYATPLQLDVRPSQFVKVYLQIIHLLALLSILLLSLPWYFQLSMVLVLAITFVHSLRRYETACRLLWSEEDWLIETAAGDHAAELLASSFITSWLTILNFRLDSGRQMSVLLLPDAIQAEQFRRLRVRLKVSGSKSGDHARMTP